MSDRIIQQRWLIRELKREKKRRLRREELQIQAAICTSCGQTGHRDARSWSCQNNSHFGQLTRRQREAQEQRERRAGGRRIRERVRNTAVRQCRYCINDGCLPHSSRRSTRCHAHIPNFSEVSETLLGPNSGKRVRKCTLYHDVRARGPTRSHRMREKRAVIREVNRVVDWVNQVAIKAQAFLSFYMLHTFSNQARNPDDPNITELLPSVFTENCIYRFIQMIVGRPITNNGTAMPTDRIAVFEHYKSLFEDASTCSVPNIPSYSNCLAQEYLVRELRRRRRQRVLKSVLNIINADTPEFTIRLNLDAHFIRDLTDFIRNTRGRLERSRIYLQGGSILHARDCFQSTAASICVCTKLHSLLPCSHFIKKFVTFTSNCWRRMFALAGVPLVQDGPRTTGFPHMVQNLDAFAQSLDFKKVRLANSEDNLLHYNLRYPPNDVPYVFDDLIRTDGHTIEFIFDVKMSESLPDLTMNDLAFEQMDQFHQYPILPGHRHLVTSVDEHGRDVQFSNNEWYYKAGIMKRRWNQQEKKKELGITDIESALPSRKTADPDYFANCCEIIFDGLPRLCSFYGSDFANDRFLNYVGAQKMANEVTNIFVNGGNKYLYRNKEDERLPLLLLGSKGTNSIRGKKSSMASKAIRALKRAEKAGLLLVCKVNEDYTSKVCCSCHQQSNECIKVFNRFSGLRVSLWGVLQCQNCHQIWNRDKNACTNIAYLANLERTGQERPEVFSRQIPYVPPPSTSSGGASNHDLTDTALGPTPSQQLGDDSAPLNL